MKAGMKMAVFWGTGALVCVLAVLRMTVADPEMAWRESLRRGGGRRRPGGADRHQRGGGDRGVVLVEQGQGKESGVSRGGQGQERCARETVRET